MKIDEELRHKIGLALNEATILGVEFDEEKKLISVTFEFVAMNKDGNFPDDNRLLFIFKPPHRQAENLYTQSFDARKRHERQLIKQT